MPNGALLKAWHLSPRQWLTLCEVGAAALFVVAALRILSVQRLLCVLDGTPRRGCTTLPEQAPHVQELARFTRAIVRRLPTRTTCLIQSLTLFGLCRRRGIAAEVKIGVAKSGEALQAHAWVESGGHVLLDEPDTEHRFPAVLVAAGGR